MVLRHSRLFYRKKQFWIDQILPTNPLAVCLESILTTTLKWLRQILRSRHSRLLLIIFTFVPSEKRGSDHFQSLTFFV